MACRSSSTRRRRSLSHSAYSATTDAPANPPVRNASDTPTVGSAASTQPEIPAVTMAARASVPVSNSAWRRRPVSSTRSSCPGNRADGAVAHRKPQRPRSHIPVVGLRKVIVTLTHLLAITYSAS
jgi:hypothetical protein